LLIKLAKIISLFSFSCIVDNLAMIVHCLQKIFMKEKPFKAYTWVYINSVCSKSILFLQTIDAHKGVTGRRAGGGGCQRMNRPVKLNKLVNKNAIKPKKVYPLKKKFCSLMESIPKKLIKSSRTLPLPCSFSPSIHVWDSRTKLMKYCFYTFKIWHEKRLA
jgi:hypothetical protein